ncbi:MAG: DNA methyltransferase [Clostridiaceae bacterium]|nr:DNA methyltransferase [Clostridiaceae bacterium]
MDDNKRCNDLSGKEWLQNSFSIWRDVSKTKEERDLKHPASYPIALCEKLLRTFSKRGCNVLDPFNGIGSTMIAASNLDCSGVGIDLSLEFCDIAKRRIGEDPQINIINGESLSTLRNIQDNIFDICITSPPYWDILNMKRSADKRDTINYSDKSNDLGNIADYQEFINHLKSIFTEVHRTLRKGGYCIVNVMDLRKKSEFYPLHCDLASEMKNIGYIFDDIIIWDRQSEYNNMRPLGYPYRFRINKVHEYLLIFIKK